MRSEGRSSLRGKERTIVRECFSNIDFSSRVTRLDHVIDISSRTTTFCNEPIFRHHIAEDRSRIGSMSGKDNRIIAVVTGANRWAAVVFSSASTAVTRCELIPSSGLGYGICQVLLRCLSLPPGSPIYEPAPVRTAVHPSLQHLLDDDESTQSQASSSKTSSSEAQPATLTLVLVCRSIRNAEKTRKLLLEEHEALLLSRANQGLAARKGWWEGLEIRCENCDFSEPGGDNGILSACERLKRRYALLD